MADFLLNLGYDRWILTALLLIPLVGAAIVLAESEAHAKRIAFWVTAVEFLVSVGLWWTFSAKHTFKGPVRTVEFSDDGVGVE